MVFTTTLSQVLQSLGLEQYLQTLRDEGFETWAQLLDITEDDMVSLGIKVGHRRRLQRAISDSKWKAANVSPSKSEDGLRLPDDNGRTDDVHIDSHRFQDGASRSSQAAPAKRKYRRHPKPDENAPDRPPSAYVIYSNIIRDRLKDQELSFTEIAKLVGENWQNPDPEERAVCERQAQSMKETYYTHLNEYKKTPEHASYQRYLADFRETHGDKNTKEVKKSKGPGDLSCSTRSNSGDHLASGRLASSEATLQSPQISPEQARTRADHKRLGGDSPVITNGQQTLDGHSPSVPFYDNGRHMSFSSHTYMSATSGSSSLQTESSWESDASGYRSQNYPSNWQPSSKDVDNDSRDVDMSTYRHDTVFRSRAPQLPPHDLLVAAHDRRVSDVTPLDQHSPTSPIDWRNRVLPLPAGLPIAKIEPDGSLASRQYGYLSLGYASRPMLPDQRASLNLPPIWPSSDDRRSPHG